MSLNTNEAPESKKGLDLPLLEEETYPARLLSIVDVGMHEVFFDKKSKGVKQLINFTFELVDEQVDIEDENGEPDTITRWVGVNNVAVTSSEPDIKSWQHRILKALDPTDKVDGDLSELLGSPLLITIQHKLISGGPNKGKEYAAVAGLSKPMKGQKVSELNGNTVLFDFDDIDVDVYEKLPAFVQDKIQEANNFSDVEGELFSSEEEEEEEEAEKEAHKAKAKAKAKAKVKAKDTNKKEAKDDDDNDDY